jgi:hypothetical protein
MRRRAVACLAAFRAIVLAICSPAKVWSLYVNAELITAPPAGADLLGQRAAS